MELELKFALPLQDPALLPKLLAQVPLIGRRRPQRQPLHNTYYDTPEHTLQQQHAALRVRQVGSAEQPHWLQTLKLGGTSDSALSRRGEWEAPLADAQLSPQMLADTPWAQLDPQGALYAALVPVFTTTFERLRWVVKLGGATLEIALDRGSVLIDGNSTALCELEIELLGGAPEALFDAATQISEQLCLLPLHMSKAERAYRLSQGTLYAPLRARPALLNADMGFDELARSVLREAFLQFTANLHTWLGSEAPETLHQSRVGWRRFKSALKLFGQDHDKGLPALAPLHALLQTMTALRDLDVTACEVLPAHAAAYQEGDATRVLQWQQFESMLAQDRLAQGAALRQAVAEPDVGRTLLHITRWLELGTLQLPRKPGKHKPKPAAPWLRKRVLQLAEELKSTQRLALQDAQAQHRLRMLSKRLRYAVESLRGLLPHKRAERWCRVATQTQTRIGHTRDSQLAIATAQRLQAAPDIVGFLRGAAFAAASAQG